MEGRSLEFGNALNSIENSIQKQYAAEVKKTNEDTDVNAVKLTQVKQGKDNGGKGPAGDALKQAKPTELKAGAEKGADVVKLAGVKQGKDKGGKGPAGDATKQTKPTELKPAAGKKLESKVNETDYGYAFNLARVMRSKGKTDEEITNVLKLSGMNDVEIKTALDISKPPTAEVKVEEKFAGYEWEEQFDLDVVIPSFTIHGKFKVDKAKWDEDDAIIKQAVRVDMDTFENNVEDILDAIVPEAVAKALQGKLPEQITTKDAYIGSHTAGFPKSIHFNLAGKNEGIDPCSDKKGDAGHTEADKMQMLTEKDKSVVDQVKTLMADVTTALATEDYMEAKQLIDKLAQIKSTVTEPEVKDEVKEPEMAEEVVPTEAYESFIMNDKLQEMIDTALDLNVEIKEAKKDDPKAKVRNRGDVVLPAGSKGVKDDKDHFPINNQNQAKNALARVNQYKKAPKWFDGSLDNLVKKVANSVQKKYKDIEVSKASKTPGKG
jgi:hypothetical protein